MQPPLPPFISRPDCIDKDDVDYLNQDKEAFNCVIEDDESWASSGGEEGGDEPDKGHASSTLSAFTPRIKMAPNRATVPAKKPREDSILSRRWNSAVRAVSMRREPQEEADLRGSLLKVAPPTLGERLRAGGVGGPPFVRRGNASEPERRTDDPTDPRMPRNISIRGDDYVCFMGETTPVAPVERQGPRWMPKLLRHVMLRRR
jgi:hypothetical protein